MIRMLRQSKYNKLDDTELARLGVQAKECRKLLNFVREYIEDEIHLLDKELMSKSMFESVNSYSHKVANLTGSKKQLLNLLKQLEEVNNNE